MSRSCWSASSDRSAGGAGADVDYQVRAFPIGAGISEDPVTGSLNAGIAQWLIGSGRAQPHYVAGQGSALRRDGRVHLDVADGEIWVGGAATTCIRGTVDL